MISRIVFVLLVQLSIFPSVQTQAVNDKRDPDSGRLNINQKEATIIVTICGFIVCALFVFDVYYYVTTLTLNRRYNTPSKTILKLLDYKDYVIDGASLQDRVSEVLDLNPSPTDSTTSRPGEKVTTHAFIDGIVRATSKSNMEFIQGARDEGKLPILQENRLKLMTRSFANLHISRLDDVYKNPMFLAAAPYPNQFADHWEAIWQEKIGVIVWVGRLTSDDGHEKMDAYIDLREGHQVKYGNFVIKTVESGDVQFKFAIFYLRVWRGFISRKVVLIHAYEWLQESVSWSLQRDIEMLMCLKDEHIRQTRDSGLRGVMLQCKLGTAGSCSLLAVYMGFQFWLRSGKVNFYGILQYIRRMRPMAFEMTGDPYHTFLIQVKVAYTVFYGVAMFCSKGIAPLFEKWIHKKLVKRDSLSDSPREVSK